METPAECREDAPEQVALARERRLQACRLRLRAGTYDRRKAIEVPSAWSAEDVPDLRWVDALAQAGHVGAQRLLESVLEDEERFEPAMPLAPELFESLAKTHPRIALSVIKRECAQPAPNPEILQRWLPLLPGGGAAAAAAVAEIARVRAPTAGDGAVIRTSIGISVHSSAAGLRESQEEVIADTLWRCAKKGGDGAQRLAARAAELGSASARLEYLLAGDSRFAADDDTWWGELCSAIRETRAIAPLSNADRDYFRRQLETIVPQGPRSRPETSEPMRARFLHQVAQAHLKSGERDIGSRLRLRAAELGCIDSITASLDYGAERILAWLEAGGSSGRAAAGKLRGILAAAGGITPADFAPKLEQVRELFARATDIGRLRKALCLRTGAAIELGEVGAPDRERAIEWYSLALSSAPRNANGEPSRSFYWEVAAAFDPAEADCALAEPRLAIAWYDRGISLGGQLCLQRLLRAGAAGDLGLARDPDAALKRLDAFFSAPGHRIDHNHTAETIGELRHRAKEDPASAAKWNQAADRLLPPERS
jgi:hypothetical protein